MKLYWIWLDGCLSSTGIKKSFWKWSSDRSSPNSIRSFSAKDYLSGFRSLRRNRKRSNKAESKNLTRGNRSEQTKQHTTTNENEKRVFVFRLGFFKLKIKMKNTRYLHLTNEWKRNEQKKKKISFCFTFFANGPELRPQENGFL